MSLNDAIVRALALDPVIRKKYSDVTEAGGYSREMRSALGPQLILEGSAGWANRDRSIDGVASGGDDLFSRQIGLVFEQLLFDGGFHRYRWKDAEQRLRAEQLLDIAQRETTAIGTVAAYLEVIRAREHVVLARTNLDLHGKIRERAAKRAEAAGNQADVELSSARYNQSKTLLLERELALKQADIMLFRYTGQRTTELLKPHQSRIASSGEIDVTQNYHYQAALHQREAATLVKKAVKARYMPRVLFRGTGGLGEDVLGIRGQDNEASALVVVQWDLFDSGRRKGLIEQAIADVDRQTAIIDETLVLLSQDTEARWADYSTVTERIRVMEEYAGQLKKTVELYEEQFELGTRPLLGVLDIQNEEIAALIRLVDDRFDYDLSTYRLLFFGGQLISQTVGSEFLQTPRGQGEGDNHEIHPSANREPVPTTVPSPTATDSLEQQDLEPSKRRRFNPFGIFGKK